jgi:hypothetical protein
LASCSDYSKLTTSCLIFFAQDYLDNVFAHAHFAAFGWIAMMTLGFELKLIPTMGMGSRLLGTLGLAGSFLAWISVLPFALILVVAVSWHVLVPARALLRCKVREWELVPLLFLLLAAVLGICLALGVPETGDPARGRVQLAYGFLALFGFMVSTVVSVAVKLFSMWVWKERFEANFGKQPVLGMKELVSLP